MGLSKHTSGHRSGYDPRTRRSLRRNVDLVGGLDTAGRRMAARTNETLERRPVRVPVIFVLFGAAALAGAFGLVALAGRLDRGAAAFDAVWLSATLLYASGGLAIIAGLAGLLSALVVHIVMRRERRL